MEEVQNEMRANSAKKHAFAAARAGEKAMKHPQLMDSNLIIPTDPHGMPHSRGSGNDAGMRRLLGRTRKPKKEEEQMEAESSSDESVEGGAKHQGRMLAEHLAKLHGAGYAKRFMKGMGMPGDVPAMARVPHGREVAHAQASQVILGERGGLGGQNVPMNGVAARAYGSPPQAPASFARNSVGEGMPAPSVEAAKRRMKGGSNGRMVGMGMETTSTNLPSAQIGNGKPKRSNARGQAISRLMKEKGMSLGEASRYLKEHCSV